MGGGSSASSSGEEDGDADWKAAIDSVSTVDVRVSAANGFPKRNPDAGDSNQDDSDRKKKAATPSLKLYQIKAQKLLDDLVGKSLEMVRNPIPESGENPQSDEGGIRLFSKAPPGILVDPVDLYSQPLKRRRIIPGEEIDEKSKKFRRQLRSVAVDGVDIMSAAKDACQRSLARFEAKDAAAKAAARREEERIAQLKKVKGEKWLPSIAREMQGETWTQRGC